jgi:hypothetical protein
MKCFIASTMFPLVIHPERVATPNVSGWAWTQRSTMTGGTVLPAALMKQHVVTKVLFSVFVA